MIITEIITEIEPVIIGEMNLYFKLEDAQTLAEHLQAAEEYGWSYTATPLPGRPKLARITILDDGEWVGYL